MKRRKTILRTIPVLACAWLLVLIAAKKLPAAFSVPVTSTSVEIDGVDYGDFEEINGLEQFGPDGLPGTIKEYYAKVRLTRHFVTDPSLYLWAKNRRSKKTDLNNIQLVKRDVNGDVISRQTLELCQPLSWSIEKANPSLGGFNETIDLAVQKLSIQ